MLFFKIQEITNKKKKKKTTKDDKSGSTSHHASQQQQQSEADLEAYEKAKQKLLAKTKLYEKMQSGQMEDVEDFRGETRYLVDFQQKAFDDGLLGKHQQEDETTEISRRTITSEAIYEANEEHREKLHEKWRQEQEDILNGPVHYETIKFDEIRDLGTGYYAFSKDEEERQKQLEELQTMRKQTISIQQRKDQLQLKRKAALQERLKKVKQRKARESGLPLELDEPDSEPSLDNTNVHEDSIDSKNSSNELSETPIQTIQSEESTLNEEMLQECRKASTMKEREWDKGKQSQYVPQNFVKPKTPAAPTTTLAGNGYQKMLEERRKERPDEFAPPGFY